MWRILVVVLFALSLIPPTVAAAEDGCSMAVYEQLVFSPEQIQMSLDGVAEPVAWCLVLDPVFIRHLCLCCPDGSGQKDCFYMTCTTDDPDAILLYCDAGCKFMDFNGEEPEPPYVTILEEYCQRTQSNPCI